MNKIIDNNKDELATTLDKIQTELPDMLMQKIGTGLNEFLDGEDRLRDLLAPASGDPERDDPRFGSLWEALDKWVEAQCNEARKKFDLEEI